MTKSCYQNNPIGKIFELIYFLNVSLTIDSHPCSARLPKSDGLTIIAFDHFLRAVVTSLSLRRLSVSLIMPIRYPGQFVPKTEKRTFLLQSAKSGVGR